MSVSSIDPLSEEPLISRAASLLFYYITVICQNTIRNRFLKWHKPGSISGFVIAPYNRLLKFTVLKLHAIQCRSGESPYPVLILLHLGDGRAAARERIDDF
jgi:hypothetical protein